MVVYSVNEYTGIKFGINKKEYWTSKSERTYGEIWWGYNFHGSIDVGWCRIYTYIYIYIYLGHPWDTFSCPDPQKLSFHSFWRFSRPRSKVHALSGSRTVFHALLAKLRSNYVHIAFELRSNYVQLRSSCAKITYNIVQCHRLKALYEKPSRTTIPVQLSNSLLFLIWTGKGVLGVPQVYKYVYIYYQIWLGLSENRLCNPLNYHYFICR